MLKIKSYNQAPEGTKILDNLVGNAYYIDSFGIDVSKLKNYSIDELILLLFNSGSPKWIEILSEIRDFIAGLFKLKTGLNEKSGNLEEYVRINPGDKIGFFPVIDRSDDEIVMAKNDRHLYFRVSVLIQDNPENDVRSVFITTLVQFHNMWGRIYFLPVKPVHKQIVRSTLKKLIKHHRELKTPV